MNGDLLRLVDGLSGAAADMVARVQRSVVFVESRPFGFGAGLIWRQDGLIVTNQHIVRRGRPRVMLADGRVFDARFLAQDPEVDLALLQIEAADLPSAPIADGRGLRVGQLVMAVGHPWGQRGMVTAGVVTGLGAALMQRGPGRRNGRMLDLIRSDVELAPGNSGGPLVNAAGAVIGINTMIVGGDLGVAIPAHLVERFVEQNILVPGAVPAGAAAAH